MLFLDLYFNTIDSLKVNSIKLNNIKQARNYYNTPENIEALKSKTLLIYRIYQIADDSLNIKYFQKINLHKLCKGYKLVDENEIAEYIRDKSSEYVYLHLSMSSYEIVDLHNRKVIYVDMENVPLRSKKKPVPHKSYLRNSFYERSKPPLYQRIRYVEVPISTVFRNLSGGKIEVHSEENNGTVFCIELYNN